MPDYKVSEIEGIGDVYSAKLEQAGIKKVNPPALMPNGVSRANNRMFNYF